MTSPRPARSILLALSATLLLAFTTACGGESGGCPGAPSPGSDPDPALAYPPVGTAPETLDEWDLFKDAALQIPKDNVIPFEVSSPLFTDFALKHRFMYVPQADGCNVGYDETDKWDFPVGTVLIKTFAFPVDEGEPQLGEQLIETRLLVKETGSLWRPFVYQWTPSGDVAVRNPVGNNVAVTYTLADDSVREIPNYAIPEEQACVKCHDVGGRILPLGPSTPMLNVSHDYGSGAVNQIDHMTVLGLFDRTPEPAGQRLTYPDPFAPGGDATDKARAYLQSNCGHCHSRTGPVADKTLYLDWSSTDPMGETDPVHWGVCKPATSAGNTTDCEGFALDIEPGVVDDSLLACRVETVKTGLMPPIGRSQLHPEGLALIEQWIVDMDYLPSCN